MARGLDVYPANHKLGTKVPEGGSRCGNCVFRDGRDCINSAWVDAPAKKGGGGGDPEIPEDPDQYCCDLWAGDA